MADQLLEKVQDVLEGQIDFEGQRLAELLTTGVLSATGAIAFILGFVLQDIRLSLWTGLGGTALTFLIVVPPWPFFKQHPLQWLPAQGQTGGISIEVDGKKVS
ncbi:microsomal signal peptidase 12 kDa subunit [Viridothelium virens]|uniref:Signal peptidase complex subunit 1 n=1 Tax=Viridothelium virens TaxID=1048519 RepID=A0A6A6HKM9_VIRVR|nr:microsomal signal peptidase 12 kDa subunit [Viridothelium virens]